MIISNGNVAPNASDIIDKLCRHTHEYRCFVNDIIEIEADYFEFELTIYFDEKP